jgi:hypothetical protein
VAGAVVVIRPIGQTFASWQHRVAGPLGQVPTFYVHVIPTLQSRPCPAGPSTEYPFCKNGQKAANNILASSETAVLS